MVGRYPSDHIPQSREDRLSAIAKWQSENKAKVKQYKHRHKHIAKQTARDFVNSIKQNSPCRCGESRLYCLEFHHRDQKEKKYLISKMVASGYSIDAISCEISKCDVVCSNCHRSKHFTDSKYNNPKGRYIAEVKRQSHCSVCQNSLYECLDFHHNVDEKETWIGQMIRDKNYTLDEVKNELSKCIVLCSNCHREHHRE